MGTGALTINSTGYKNVAIGHTALQNNSTNYANVAVGYASLKTNSLGNNNSALGYNTSSGGYSDSVILGKAATATANGQFVLGSAGTPIGPVATETKAVNRTLEINLNGALYKLLMYKA